MKPGAISVFDVFKIADRITKLSKRPSKCCISVVYDEGDNAYCLARLFGGEWDVLLTKAMADRNEFDKEVENLIKYFDADKIEEK